MMLPLPLVRKLLPLLQAECAGLENGAAPILEKVTPVTADLLRWWFQQDCIDGRAINFHEGQRQAILHTIYAHEVVQPETLVDLYQKVAAEDLLTARRYEEVLQSNHPKYCLKMATGTGKTWVAETKGQTMLSLPDVERKRKAAVAWCDRINELPEGQRSGRPWSYALIGEDLFYGFDRKGASMEDILNFARLRPKVADKESLL